MQIKIARVRKKRAHLNCDEELKIISALSKKTIKAISLKRIIIISLVIVATAAFINSGVVAFSYNVFLNGEKIGTVRDIKCLENAYNKACEKNGRKIFNGFSVYPSFCSAGNLSKEEEIYENILLSGGGFKKCFALKMGEEVIFLARDEQIILAILNKFMAEQMISDESEISSDGEFKIEYGIFSKKENENPEELLEKLKAMQPEPVDNSGFLQPVLAEVSSGFGQRWGREHKGIDFAANEGEYVLASDGGKVKFSGYEETYGNLVIIEHSGGYDSYYAHMCERCVNEGDAVEKGQIIGRVGSTGNSTGPHLHFEIRFQGVAVNPADFIAF